MGVSKIRVMVSVILCLILHSMVVTSTYADSANRRNRRKSDDRQVTAEALQKLQTNIGRYERLAGKCGSGYTERCADILFDLATLQQQYQRDLYIKELNDYEKLMKKWDKNPEGDEPLHPVPDYSRPIAIFERLANEYPKFHSLDRGYYQVGNLYLLTGELDKSEEAFKNILNKFPQSSLLSPTYFRLSDFSYMKKHYTATLKQLNKVKKTEVTPVVWEMVYYRRGECHLHLAAFDKAVEYFFNYIEKCNTGEFSRKELQNEALTNMIIAFSDMPDGAKEAVNFFKKHNERPYEAQVLYGIGMKNREHAQFDQAIVSLQTALEKYPLYKRAPSARYAQVESYVAKKQYDKANRSRMMLIADYKKGSSWYGKNRRNKKAIGQAQEYIKKALATMCIYYHAEAQKQKQKDYYEKACKSYEAFFRMFPDDKWKYYEFHYNVAELYDELKQYKRAVDAYWFVATEYLSNYPPRKADMIEEAMFTDPTELEKEKKERAKKMSLAFTQADAGYNAIVILDKLRKQVISFDNLSGLNAYHLPMTQELFKKCLVYRKRFPDHENTPKLLYLAGTIRYTAGAYEEALKDFALIASDYTRSELAAKASRMIAKTFTLKEKYDWALSEYQELLRKVDKKSKEYRELLDLAASTIYSKAEKMRKNDNFHNAAEVFKSVHALFPASSIADRAWFEAAVCYEQARSSGVAAQTFKELTRLFPESALLNKAFYRSAENYQVLKKWEQAASILIQGAKSIPEPTFAIPSFSTAARCYEKMKKFDKAGRTYETIANRYPKDSLAPLALHNTALMSEKGGNFAQSLETYNKLEDHYPNHEYAQEAAFSKGFTLKKLGRQLEAAKALTNFANKFAKDPRSVKALVVSGDIYYKMSRTEEAKTAYVSAVATYNTVKGGGDGNLAKAHFMLGEMEKRMFLAIKLNARSEKQIREDMRRKTKKLEDAIKQYALAIKTGVQEWVFKSNYQIGMSFIGFAGDEKNQRIFARNNTQRMAAKLALLPKLERYYQEAQTKFGWNIEKSNKDKIHDLFVDSSKTMFIKMAYSQGQLYEELADMFDSAPVPKGLSPEQRRLYMEEVEEKVLEIRDKAYEKYCEGVKAARELRIDSHPDMEMIYARIFEINPVSEWLIRGETVWAPSLKNDELQNGADNGVPIENEDSTFIEF